MITTTRRRGRQSDQSSRLHLPGIVVFAVVLLFGVIVICLAWYPILSSAFQPTESNGFIAVNQTIRISMPDPSTASEFRITLPVMQQQQYPGRLGIEVYSYISAGCPPISPFKTVIIPKEFQHVKLQEEEQQWQSFHLNRGSEITLDAIQEHGSTDFYILRGQHADWNYYRMRMKSRKDRYGFWKDRNPNYQTFALPSTTGSSDESFITARRNYTFFVDSDDLYTIVYANPSHTESVFSLRIRRIETNYEVSERDVYRVLSSTLSATTPSSPAPKNECIWNKQTTFLPSDKQCIIVKGVDLSGSESSASVPFQTLTTPDWMVYMFRCGLPFLLIPILACLSWCCSNGETHDDLTQRITLLRRQQQQDELDQNSIRFPSETTPILGSTNEAARNPISCPYCTRSCWGESQFQIHLLRRHRDIFASTVAQFPCGFCRTIGTPQILFTTEQALQVHIEQEHGLRYESSVPVAEAMLVEGTAIPNYGDDNIAVDTMAAVAAEPFQEDIPLAQSTIVKDEDYDAGAS
jgi:hypothetical protein